MDFLLVINSKNVYFLSCSHLVSLSEFYLPGEMKIVPGVKNYPLAPEHPLLLLFSLCLMERK